MKRYPVVILPGWMLGATRFEPLKKELSSRGYRTYVVDFPGFVEGERIIRPWTLGDYTQFLEAYLRRNHLKQAIFICHSFGGRVALKLLSEKPALAKALILSGTPGFRSTHSTRLFTIATISKIGKAIMSLPPLSVFQDVARKLFNILVGARDISALKGFMRQTFINIVEEDLEGYMRKLSVPTLLLWGARDSLVAPSIARRMNETIGNSTLTVVPEAYHNLVYREPKKFTHEIEKFLHHVE
ncbi:TPA: hypothetical protein DIV55_02140 [Patescibacteria group bacterium]|uniref:Serine aminopeptidase S33 domain-containing protein n=1 Tax=Candidatus Gottesmanbacteria bacterium GW2011_GWA1_43_11 TaxID=1618436 RepID=A0A0G1FDX9_9BACT|nr:MAG: hypothetical protein UV59_C0011G0004 [Candidatus Gottesmanbacteria bacterium GW2011_GWA1_43_11]HCS78522.1 hypothetical protein [Patescibacteria group bacterium]